MIWEIWLTIFACPQFVAVASLADGVSSSCSTAPDVQLASMLLQARSVSRELAAPGYPSRFLSNTMQQMATQLPTGSTKELIESFKVCGSCTNWQRLGEDSDGGYLVCMDHMQNNQIRAAYSLGVADHDKFSSDVYDAIHVPIYQFDCTVAGPASNCPDCHFNQICIKGSSGLGAHPVGPNMDLMEVLNLTGQLEAPRASLIMKMDVEGSEWPIIADGGVDLSKFQQLVLEFHGIDRESLHGQYAQAMRTLLSANFSVAHIHGNNWAPMYTRDGFSIPNAIEVTMLLDAPALPTCVAQPTLSPLDHKNYVGNPELPNTYLEPTLVPPTLAPQVVDMAPIAAGALK